MAVLSHKLQLHQTRCVCETTNCGWGHPESQDHGEGHKVIKFMPSESA